MWGGGVGFKSCFVENEFILCVSTVSRSSFGTLLKFLSAFVGQFCDFSTSSFIYSLSKPCKKAFVAKASSFTEYCSSIGKDRSLSSSFLSCVHCASSSFSTGYLYPYIINCTWNRDLLLLEVTSDGVPSSFLLPVTFLHGYVCLLLGVVGFQILINQELHSSNLNEGFYRDSFLYEVFRGSYILHKYFLYCPSN